jgi:hypothetical protein
LSSGRSVNWVDVRYQCQGYRCADCKDCKSVSVDIKGDIEKLVDHLPDIARQLVSSKILLPLLQFPKRSYT